MKSFFKKHLGLILCIGSLALFCLAKLPYNLSVIGAGENEGFSFVYGQNFLIRHEFAPGRGPLFILLYALILKIFGFNTWSIIACHYVQTIVVLLIGTVLYLTVKEVLKNSFYGGLSALFYILLILTPVGKAELFELVAHYTLEAEYLCVLFSLLSILFLVLSNFFNENHLPISLRDKMFSFLSGTCAVCSVLFKTNGVVMLIALLLWFVLLFVGVRRFFDLKRGNVLYSCFGMIFSFIFCNVVLFLMKNDLITFWKDCILIGSYTHDYFASLRSFVLSVFNFMTRYKASISNFILFFIVFVLYFWCILRTLLIKDNFSKFCLLIGIWGFGNICAIIAPGMYQPYYYDLIWPSIALVFTIGLNDLFSFLPGFNKKILNYSLTVIIAIFFAHRLILVLPYHLNLAQVLSVQNIFNQPESFQDPVRIDDNNGSKRPSILKVGDFVNSLLPDKKDTVYTFNFDSRAYLYFTSLVYMYAKRYPPTSISSGLLSYDCILDRKLEILKRDLTEMPPKILIVSKKMEILSLNDNRIILFLNWFNDFISRQYMLKATIDYDIKNESGLVGLNIYEKLK